MIIQPEDLSYTLTAELSRFAGDTTEILEHAAEVAAAHAVAELNTESPNRTGAYAKDWAKKKGSYARLGGIRKVIVYNKKHYQLTHLLENGHRKVVFGHRVGGSVAARVHIAPIGDEAAREFEELVKEGIRRGSG